MNAINIDQIYKKCLIDKGNELFEQKDHNNALIFYESAA